MEWPVLMVVIGVLIVGILIAAIIMHKKYGTKPNYRVFFIIGVTWIPLGIATKNFVFSAAGIVMMIVGLSKKKEWREEPKWNELPPQARRLKLILIGIITLTLAAMLVFLLLKY